MCCYCNIIILQPSVHNPEQPGKTAGTRKHFEKLELVNVDILLFIKSNHNVWVIMKTVLALSINWKYLL